MAAKSATTQSQTTESDPFSFLSKGWRDVRISAESDIQLMKSRAKSFKNLATSFDREIENNLLPKITEFRRVYSSPDFSRKVLESWTGPKAGRIRLDLSAIKNAIVSEVVDEGTDGILEFRRRRGRGRIGILGGGGERESGWEPFRTFKRRLEEFDDRVKASLKSIYKEPQESKEVPPLDFPELLAYLVRQSGPFLDQFGVRRDFCDKIVDNLCSKRKDQLLSKSLSAGDSMVLENDNINDELDLRIASVLQSTGYRYEGGIWPDSKKNYPSDGKRHVAIVTTASLPWMTGTAVNPLFRAAYLAQSAKQNVTLLVPWLCKSDQELVYPSSVTFSSPEEQETYIRNWLEERIGFKAEFKISFYPGKFSKDRRSIMPTGDTSQFIPSKDADIAILEEPEHLNWYHHGKRWTDKFNHVVGVVHTNYLEYIKREKYGAFQAFMVKHINNIVAKAYCHKVLRLSAATQDLPKSIICNVHGVNPKFLKIGEKLAAERAQGEQAFSKGAYFLGKMVWAKGYKELIDLLSKHKNDLDGFKLDVYGNGEDAFEVQSTAKKLDLNLNFMKGRDHADSLLHGYKVFINPSVSDVLCTATAEALAMGKFVVCAEHPSNEFFKSYPNCLTYKTSEDFVSKVKEALENEPHPLTPEQRYNLSWEAATQRFLQYSELETVLNNHAEEQKSAKNNGKITKSVSMPNLTDVADGGLAFVHYWFTGNEFLRLCTGAIPNSRDYDKQHCKDLNLLPPQVENPIYGW